MPQTAITDYYNSRKRPASEDIVTSKSSKVAHLCPSVINSRINAKGKNSHNDFTRVEETIPCEPLKISTAVRKLDYTEEPVVLNGSLKSRTFSKKVNSSNLAKGQELSETSKIETFSTKVNSSNISTLQEQSECSKVDLKLTRKDLSLTDIRKRLAGSSRFAELKASADRLSKGIQQLKEKSVKHNLKEFSTIDVEVPTSPCKTSIRKELLTPKKQCPAESYEHNTLISPRKVVVSPVKSPCKVSAYVKYSPIALAASSLPLPHHYRFLAELFRGMETVVSLLHNRNEKITFAKLKPSVQEMLKRNFTQKHLAQIKHLVPDFYTFEVQKVKLSNTSNQKETYEMLVTPILPTDHKIMSPSILLERRRYFYDTLLQLTKKHHSEYLLTLDPPMFIEDGKLTRWHPEFELEKVPEVECAKMPEIPDASNYSTAQDVLSKARELFKCNTKMERALEKLAAAKARGLTKEEKQAIDGSGKNDTKTLVKTTENNTQTDQPSTSGVPILNPALRNLPTSLLEKIKAKQAAKALEAMTRSADQDNKYIIYKKLPDLARTLQYIFVTERKNVLALNVVLSKLDSSFKANISANDMQRDIELLAQEAPKWMTLHNIRGVSYLKLDKNADLKCIMNKLEKKAEQYKCD